MEGMYESSTYVIQRKPKLVRETRLNFSHNVESVECSIISKTPVWKRGMDIVFSTLMLIFLAPVLLLIYIAIKIASPGPAFFKQERVGYLGKSFNMYKFRTMKIDASESAHKNQICNEISEQSHLQ